LNIFVLDKDFDKCARYHNNRHTVKLILELAQLMSTAHHVLGSPVASKLYKPTHVNHPCSKWVRESSANYEWIYNLFLALCKEYSYRYGKEHKTHKLYKDLLAVNPCPDGVLTEFAQAMPDDVKSGDVVTAYRQYYINYKRHLASWKGRGVPGWWK